MRASRAAMSEKDLEPLLRRVADALERLSPPPAGAPDAKAADAFVWRSDAQTLEPVHAVNRVDLSLLRGIEQVRQARVVRIEVLDRQKEAENIIARTPGAANVVADGLEINFEFDGTREELIRLHTELVKSDIPLLWFREMETDLFDVFMAVTEGKVQ